MRNIVYLVLCMFLFSCTGNRKNIPWEVEYKMYKDSCIFRRIPVQHFR